MMMTMLKKLGCIWMRETETTISNQPLTISLGYIVNEHDVAQPYIVLVKEKLTDAERDELRQKLFVSNETVFGEYTGNWEWRNVHGEKIDSPLAPKTKTFMEREADINMVFLTLFASLKGLSPQIIRELINAALLTRIYLHETNEEAEWTEMVKYPEKFTF